MQSLLNIGSSGLMTAQTQLATTSHNIANASTEGYHRQVVEMTQVPLEGGRGGVRVATVVRAYDQFLANQLLKEENRMAAYAEYSARIDTLNNMLADPSIALTVSMDGLFAAVQDVANDPRSVPARIALLSSGETLVARFRSYAIQLDEARNGLEERIASSITDINRYATAIAEINQRVVDAESVSGGRPANDLRDQRDLILLQLNRLIKATPIEQSDGQLTVFIGSGQPLVIGQTVATLAAMPAENDLSRLEVAMRDRDGTLRRLPDRILSGGELGGLLQFRRESLDFAQNRIGLLATVLATTFNERHVQGVDLYGNAGGELFSLAPARVQPPAAAAVRIDPAQVGSLTDADYELSFDGTQYRLENLVTGARSDPFAAGVDVGFEGLVVNASDGALTAGGTALIQPTRFAAGNLSLSLQDPRAFAAALQSDDFGTPGFEFESFADNRNANRIGELQTTRLMLVETELGVTSGSTMSSAYAELVSSIGSRARSAQANAQAQESLLTQARMSRDQISGVNLDEEAANLLRYQSAYQASARIISIAQRLLDELLSVMR
ncbi:MAG: flagellar hook-associated protein FlgK [Sphingobacteriia bacterium]|nr:flagellar hook-associated protein FlgK [Sphingobacteriia bacterium]NCC39000.1 flagellar hook-associated protein FlgK [Gammaproteobacteria bacterium]